MSEKFTPGPWHVSGVRFRMNGGEWMNISRYNEILKKDEHVACIGYDPRTGEGFADAKFIAAAPDLYAALSAVNKLIAEAACTGFNHKDDYWLQRLFESQQQTSMALKKARGEE